ncbi:MAG: hypothetical protein H6599_02515 [Flavobacteriales bacterium]|nr:hypothetical protein [Flavobacteriales bacterium]
MKKILSVFITLLILSCEENVSNSTETNTPDVNNEFKIQDELELTFDPIILQGDSIVGYDTNIVYVRFMFGDGNKMLNDDLFFISEPLQIVDTNYSLLGGPGGTEFMRVYDFKKFQILEYTKDSNQDNYVLDYTYYFEPKIDLYLAPTLNEFGDFIGYTGENYIEAIRKE